MNTSYATAYSEVYEILKYIPKKEFNMIPKSKIEFLEKNRDQNYVYYFNPKKSLEEQKISRKAYAIIVSFYMDYFASDIKREKIEKVLKNNENKYQEELREKYNPDLIFKNKNTQTEQYESINQENVSLVCQNNDKSYKKAISFIRKIINKKKI